HTYLEGTGSLTYLGLWAMGTFHSTATLSPEGTCGLYVPLVHALSKYLACSTSATLAGWALFFAGLQC
ncbi:hypothetical protein HETIRDRAFT_56295, partial [Heterobasidion irregulare TC 32-1]